MKKVTILISTIIFLSIFSVNAQNDINHCAQPKEIDIGANESMTIEAPPVDDTPFFVVPGEVCSDNSYEGYAVENFTVAYWFSINPEEDMEVTVFKDAPETTDDYFPAFNIYKGFCDGNVSTTECCADLPCLGGAITEQNSFGTFQPIEFTFFAEAGERYYIAFDNFFTWGGIGDNVPYEFEVTTVSEGNMDVQNINSEEISHYVDNETLHLEGSTSLEHIEIYNLAGKELISKNLETTSEEIKLNNLSSGVYIANLQIDNQTKTFRVIK